MANHKYIISDGSDEIGFLVINTPSEPTFQHVTNSTIPDGPLSDAVLLVSCLAGFTAFSTLACYWSDTAIWIGPMVGVVLTAALAGLKAWRSGPMGQDSENEAAGEITIKVEAWGDDGLIMLEEIRDKSISLDDWRKVARAILDGSNFSRPALTGNAGISQTTYHKMKAEFERLNFAHKVAGNRTVLSPRAMVFLRKVDSLPY